MFSELVGCFSSVVCFFHSFGFSVLTLGVGNGVAFLSWSRGGQGVGFVFGRIFGAHLLWFGRFSVNGLLACQVDLWFAFAELFSC